MDLKARYEEARRDLKHADADEQGHYSEYADAARRAAASAKQEDYDIPAQSHWEFLNKIMDPTKFRESLAHGIITKEFIMSKVQRQDWSRIMESFNLIQDLIWHGSKKVWKIEHARMVAVMIMSSAHGIDPWLVASAGGYQHSETDAERQAREKKAWHQGGK